MGNAAGVIDYSSYEEEAGASQQQLAELDLLASSGYFLSHENTYNEAMSKAIQGAHLDSIEILLSAGNTRRLETPPMAQAALYGHLDVLELLVSAGFDPCLADEKGRTPLHVCAAGAKAPDCAAYLALVGGARLCKMRDKEGLTCIHMAAHKGNVQFLNSVLSCFNSKTVTELVTMADSMSGQRALDIAHEKHHQPTVDLLVQYLSLDSSSKGGKGKGSKASRQSEPEVDPARLMAVWERFFENAMKRMLVEEMDTDGVLMVDTQGYYQASNAVIPPAVVLQKHQPSIFDHRDRAPTGAAGGGSAVVGSQRNPKDLATVENIIREWFTYVLLYQTDPVSQQEQYYVLDMTNTSHSYWLQDFLDYYAVKNGGLTLSVLSAQQAQVVYELPTEVTTLIQYAWLTYYDPLSNSSMWLNAHTWQCESTLPIGNDPSIHATGLVVYDKKEVPPSQQVQSSWVLCVADEPYYYNQITDATSWDPPPQYDDIIQQQNGWALCTSADSQWQPFWHHQETGVSQWT